MVFTQIKRVDAGIMIVLKQPKGGGKINKYIMKVNNINKMKNKKKNIQIVKAQIRMKIKMKMVKKMRNMNFFLELLMED